MLNAAWCFPAREAAKRQLQDGVVGSFRAGGNAGLTSGDGASNRSRRRCETPDSSSFCTSPWQQGAGKRDGRGAEREPSRTDQSPRSSLAVCHHPFAASAASRMRSTVRAPKFPQGGGGESPHAAWPSVPGPEKRLAPPGLFILNTFFVLWLEGLRSFHPRFPSLPQVIGVAGTALAHYHRRSPLHNLGNCRWMCL